MPSATYILNLIAIFVVDRAITVKMHVGDPGPVGALNEVAVAGYLPPIVVLANWTILDGNAEITDALNFGLFTEARDGISHYTLWDGANFMSSQAFLVPMNVRVKSDCSGSCWYDCL